MIDQYFEFITTYRLKEEEKNPLKKTLPEK